MSNFCIKCGRENREEAQFCKKCGAKIETDLEEETRVAKRSEDSEESDEPEVFSIRPTLMFVQMGYALAVISAFLLAALLATVGSIFSLAVSSGIVVLLGISLLLIPAYYHVRQKTVRYTLTDSKMEIDEGLLSKTTRNVPLRIIQDVTVSANFFQRILGFGDVEIENANESDEKIVLKNINTPKKYAAILLEQMRRLNK
ncbi:MAG: PH domain-containing protein [Acidobacteriota bacterium]|nr:PH domain-containing protein [Acidobacteriota bacterium]MDH3529403.1 PH domain-containing protein [Acidobacteriota bacterium]